MSDPKEFDIINLLAEVKYMFNTTTSNNSILIILNNTIIALVFEILYNIIGSKLLQKRYVLVKVQ